MIPGIRDLQNIFPAEYGAGYYLISNLIASVTAAFMLIPAVRGDPASDKTEIASAFIYLFVAFADQRGYGYRQ